MNPLTIIQIVSGIATLAAQVTPLALQLKAALESGDDAQLDALLKQVQAANDALGAA